MSDGPRPQAGGTPNHPARDILALRRPGRPLELGRALGAFVREIRDLDDAAAIERLMTHYSLDAFAGDRRELDDPRYVPAALPDLPFADGAFRLALSGYLLFAYPDHLDPAAHEAALRELLRVAGEVRVYPLVDTAYVRYPGIDDLRSTLERDGVASEVRRVDYAFQAGADEVLVLRRP